MVLLQYSPKSRVAHSVCFRPHHFRISCRPNMPSIVVKLSGESGTSIFLALIIHVFLDNSHALTRGKQRQVAPSQLPSAYLSPKYPDILKHSAFTLMSHTQSAATSSSKFHTLFNDTLDTYRKRTGKDLLTHSLAPRLQACNTPAAILTILREQLNGLDQSRGGAERWSKWLDPTVNVLFAFSATIEAGVGLVCVRNCTHSRSAFSYSFSR